MTPLKNPQVTSLYGWRTLNGKREFHYGQDMVDYGGNTGCRALWNCIRVDIVLGWNGGRGNTAYLYYSSSLRALYQHMQDKFNIASGVKARQGDVIGYYGSSGNVTGPHLHVEIQKLVNGRWTVADPAQYTEVPNRAGRHTGNDKLDGGGAVSASPAPAPEPGTLYKAGDRVTFGSGYATSTATGEKNAYFTDKVNANKGKGLLKYNKGTIGKVLKDAPNPYQILSPVDGKTVICWCNDGDIRGRW